MAPLQAKSTPGQLALRSEYFQWNEAPAEQCRCPSRTVTFSASRASSLEQSTPLHAQVAPGYQGPLLSRPLNASCVQIPNELPGVFSVAALGVQRRRSYYSNYSKRFIQVPPSREPGG